MVFWKPASNDKEGIGFADEAFAAFDTFGDHAEKEAAVAWGEIKETDFENTALFAAVGDNVKGHGMGRRSEENEEIEFGKTDELLLFEVVELFDDVVYFKA